MTGRGTGRAARRGSPGATGDRVRVVVVGGGASGWMTAAALRKLVPQACEVTLVESEAIGIIGVGEATLPHLRGFNARLGIDEADFMSATKATFKLGIQFENWGRIGDRYVHPFARFGRDVRDVPFHHFWTRAMREGLAPGDLQDYCLPVAMCRRNLFAPPSQQADRVEASFGYAYQFDANLYAPFLRQLAEAAGVRRVEGKIVQVEQDTRSGAVDAVLLDDGRRVGGDLFIDCSGFRSLLIGETLGEPFEDWSRWLPCDRAVAAPSPGRGPIAPYTSAIAQSAGWRWRIPLQHRVGNGYVHASAFVDEQTAIDTLVAALEAPPLVEPRILRFTAGRRRRAWVSNVVSIGLASGFLEPLESTSLYLIQAAITQLLESFPERRIADVDREAFNRAMAFEYDRARDFLILHYHATERDDSAFWRHVRTMPVPDSLVERLELFRARGRIQPQDRGLFQEPSWLAVLIGQRVVPGGYDARVGAMPAKVLSHSLGRMLTDLGAALGRMPSHEHYLASYCPAGDLRA